jgi:hypothetical protein
MARHDKILPWARQKKGEGFALYCFMPHAFALGRRGSWGGGVKEKARQEHTIQESTRQHKARQDKMRQDKTRPWSSQKRRVEGFELLVLGFALCCRYNKEGGQGQGKCKSKQCNRTQDKIRQDKTRQD